MVSENVYVYVYVDNITDLHGGRMSWNTLYALRLTYISRYVWIINGFNSTLYKWISLGICIYRRCCRYRHIYKVPEKRTHENRENYNLKMFCKMWKLKI